MTEVLGALFGVALCALIFAGAMWAFTEPPRRSPDSDWEDWPADPIARAILERNRWR